MFWTSKKSMKDKSSIDSGYKQRKKDCLMYLQSKTPSRSLCLIHFQVKMPENGRNKIYRDKQTTNKVPLMFLDVKLLTER